MCHAEFARQALASASFPQQLWNNGTVFWTGTEDCQVSADIPALSQHYLTLRLEPFVHFSYAPNDAVTDQPLPIIPIHALISMSAQSDDPIETPDAKNEKIAEAYKLRAGPARDKAIRQLEAGTLKAGVRVFAVGDMPLESLAMAVDGKKPMQQLLPVLGSQLSYACYGLVSSLDQAWEQSRDGRKHFCRTGKLAPGFARLLFELDDTRIANKELQPLQLAHLYGFRQMISGRGIGPEEEFSPAFYADGTIEEWPVDFGIDPWPETADKLKSGWRHWVQQVVLKKVRRLKT